MLKTSNFGETLGKHSGTFNSEFLFKILFKMINSDKQVAIWSCYGLILWNSKSSLITLSSKT